jgi:IS5 family transposase
MQPKKSDRQSSFLCPDQHDPRHHLLGLTKVIPWQVLEDNFRPLYAAFSRPEKPIRLMTGLLILKQLENLSGERVVERWVQNSYFQAFCGQQRFTWKLPCDPSELTYFRRRIGEDGVRKIFEVSVTPHADEVREEEVVVDSTVQEKNIAVPTDAKLLAKIVTRCRIMAKLEDVKLRRRYQRATQRAVRRLRTIAGVLTRDIRRELSLEALQIHRQSLDIYDRVQRQQLSDMGEIFSLHEPDVFCISKWKIHKKYKFGAKASVTVTKISGIFVGALSFPDNLFDGHTLPAVQSQTESIVCQRTTLAICDRGDRGKRRIGDTRIEIPESGKGPKTEHEKRQARARFRHRAAIEPIIGHLKNDHRMLRNYLKGRIGDFVNLFMACAAFNFRKFIRIMYFLCFKLLRHVFRLNAWPVQACA